MISAIVFTHDSQDQIQECLKGLVWCDEIVVVDDLSADNTQTAVTKIGSKKIRFLSHPLSGDFAAHHNFALRQATHDWVLFVDDDERVNTKLAQEIKEASSSDKFVAFWIFRSDFFMGRFLKFGETSGAKFIRLGRKSAGSWTRKVHEKWEVSGPVGQLANPIEHFPHPTLSEFVSSINFYTTIDAAELSKEGKTFSLVRIIANPLAKFGQNYFLRLGFLDGLAGFVMAYMMSFYSLTARVKQYDSFKPS